uniref:Uncharacterized protein n=1 Tax=Hyaloperonospora arabidopsidis (strain Emoy2) TaxID=559515 RepID=M4BJL3_HYAAE
MTLGVFVDEIVALKIETPASPPLILRYRERHYSAFIHSGIPNGLSGFEAGTDLLESPARYTADHQVGPNKVPAGTADARKPAKGLAEAAIVHEALPGRVRSPSDDPAPTAVPIQAIVTVESRLILPALPVTPPLGPRPTPPTDRKRGLSSSPERGHLQGALVPYQHTATVAKKVRVGEAPQRLLTADDRYERIDRGDWVSSWERLADEWPNPNQSPLPTADSSRQSGNTLLASRRTIYFGW